MTYVFQNNKGNYPHQEQTKVRVELKRSEKVGEYRIYEQVCVDSADRSHNNGINNTRVICNPRNAAYEMSHQLEHNNATDNLTHPEDDIPNLCAHVYQVVVS